MTILPKGHGPMLVRNHMRDNAVEGVFTGRHAEISSATGVPENSVATSIRDLKDTRAVQVIRVASKQHPPQYWIPDLGFAKPGAVPSVPAPVRQSAPSKPPVALPAPVVLPFGFGPMPRPDNPVRLVAPGTYPAGRFSIGARR